MASTATTSLNIEKLEPGVATSWGDEINVNWDIVDAAIAGRTTVSLNGADATLADANYTLDAAKYGTLYTTNADQDDRNIIIPNAARTYRVINASGSYNCKVKTSAGAAITIPATSVAIVSCDGANGVTFTAPITNYTTGAPNTSSGAAASAVSVSATGDLTSTDVQAALEELQGDIDAIEADLTASYQPLDADLTTIAGLSATKGNLLAGTGSWSALGVGTDGFALIAASGESAGMKWAALCPAGTKQLFYQASAPTGWTAVALNDYGLRVVSAGGTGGTATTVGDTAYSTVFATTATDGHSLTVSEMPSHNHGGGSHNHSYTRYNTLEQMTAGAVSNLWNGQSGSGTTGNSGVIISSQGGDAEHSHNITLTVQTADVIIATKDAY